MKKQRVFVALASTIFVIASAVTYGFTKNPETYCPDMFCPFNIGETTYINTPEAYHELMEMNSTIPKSPDYKESEFYFQMDLCETAEEFHVYATGLGLDRCVHYTNDMWNRYWDSYNNKHDN